jgi:RNA ligase (TIGR02306 family)
MERKLATIRKIKDIVPIEGADAIELALVDGWQVVVAKNVGHKVGDKVVYCEIDSFLPIKEEFEFLRKSSYKKMGDQEGFRLKTIKLKNTLSQGLILPYSIIPIAQFASAHVYQRAWMFLRCLESSNMILRFLHSLPERLRVISLLF